MDYESESYPPPRMWRWKFANKFGVWPCAELGFC